MTAAKTPSQRGAANRRRGHQAERDLAKWLRANGFPHAERAVRTGWATKDRASADPGDIAGTPGLVWSVKDVAAENITGWMGELTAMVVGQRADLGLLIHKRRGHADPTRWWCWMRFRHALTLAFYPLGLSGGGTYVGPAGDDPLRMELGHVVPLLHGAGYGTAPDAEAPVNGAEIHRGGPGVAGAHGCTPETAQADSEPATSTGECARSERADGLHSWRFDGDDPRIVCHYCDEMRDTITGRVLRAATIEEPA